MCRRNLFYAGLLIAFGIGLLFSIFFESALFRFLLALGSIVVGFFILKK